MIKRKRKRNPSIENIIFEFSKYKSEIKKLSFGAEADIYLLTLDENAFVYNTIFKPEYYIIKVYKSSGLRSKGLTNLDIEHLTKLSNYGLIPKIYYVDNRSIIMKYIEGDTVYNLMQNKKWWKSHKKEIQNKLEYLEEVWDNLGFFHGDLEYWNMIYTPEGKLYLIDPLF